METINQNLMLKEAFDYAEKVKEVDRFTVAKAYLDGRKKCYKAAIDLANEENSKKVNGEAYLAYEYDKNEVVVGIRVTGMGESFVVARSDAENGKRFTWDEAVKKFKIPTKKQAALMCAVLDELNDMLDRIGGEKLIGWHWTSVKYIGSDVWLFDGNDGRLFSFSKNINVSVRQVLT